MRRIMRGSFPLSLFIARASGSPFSHTGVVAIEDGSPVVYDCALEGIQRQTFEVWMLECVGQIGVKRLKAEQHHRIPGVVEYCRKVYDQQVPFDSEFRMDNRSALLRRDDRKGVSIPGAGAFRAGPRSEIGKIWRTIL